MEERAHKHQIVLSSSYSTHSRIGMDFVDDGEGFEKAVTVVRGTYGGKPVPFSIHAICTDSESWDSVVRKDPYFDDVRIIDSLDYFTGLIGRERYLKGTDVARYVLSKGRCSYTRLQRLVYLCYADYLCDTGSMLFTDRIFASRYGPSAESVYGSYRGRSWQGCYEPEPSEDHRERWTKADPMAIRSRLLFSEDGIRKTYSIDRTLEKYMGMTTEELVGLTNRQNSPWSHVERVGLYDVIPDDTIMKYHRYEV